MTINLRCLRQLSAAMVLAVGTFGAIPGAMAGVMGSATLDITNGQFSYDSSGNATFGTGTNATPYIELATGNFAYTNMLPSASLNLTYSASSVVDVNGGMNNGGQSFINNKNFGYTSLAALSTTPDGMMALGFVNMFAGATSGTGSVPAALGGYNFSWMYNNTLSANGGSGTFHLWSNVNYSGTGNPGNLLFPATASFTARMALTAVPEPAPMALLGLGLIGFAFMRKRKRHS